MKKLLSFLLLMLALNPGFSQNNSWNFIDEKNIAENLFKNRNRPSAFKIFKLDAVSFLQRISQAPAEKNLALHNSDFFISFPNAGGQVEKYAVVEAPVMDPALAARYPLIKSYAGRGVDDPSSVIRFSISPQGFHGMILSDKKSTVYIDPIDAENNLYLVVSRAAIIDNRKQFECLTGVDPLNAKINSGSSILNMNANDGLLRTYRLALCASGEFSQYWLNGLETSDAERKAKVLAAQNTQMTRANAIFEKDFGIRLILVANNDAIIYLNAASDPWGTNLNSVTQTTCDNVIGSANYDIGHLVHRASNNGNAGCIGCVCKAGSKGSAFTSYLDLGNTDLFVVDYLTHEMGHQLGGNHTFTHSNEGTIAQVEPGSGSTIMGYAGITGATTDVQPHSDDYFHAVSVQQVTNYIKSVSGSCAVSSLTGNSTPLAAAGIDYIIPRSTPFILAGTGTDTDAADVLSFCWEQNNVRGTGSSVVPSATATAGPQFRSYKPGTSLSRTFPILSSVLAGTNANKWEVLPSVARTLNFRFTVRDNHAGAGNNNSDDMAVTVSGTTGPFALTAPNTAVTWGINSLQNVTWSVNGTNGTPVNCANVNILLSTNGGLTFPVTLAAGTANDGSEIITVPDNAGTACRIKVEAAGNIFFDISNTDFTIGTAASCANPAALTATPASNSASFGWSAVSGASTYDVDYKAASSGTWIVVATATVSTSATVSGLTAATLYDWRVRTNCAAESSIYSSGSFTTGGTGGSTCPGTEDVSTNGTISGAATILLNSDVKGLINPKGDIDNFLFVITNGGTVSLTLTTLPANYNLSLHNSSGTQLAIAQLNGTSNETINTTLAAGTYYARVFGSKGNIQNAVSCYTLRVATGSASKENQNIFSNADRKTIQVFPNPAQNFIKITIAENDGNAEIRIFDIYGKMLMQQNSNKPVTQMNILKLASGLYIVKVSRNGQEINSLKFVKQ